MSDVPEEDQVPEVDKDRYRRRPVQIVLAGSFLNAQVVAVVTATFFVGLEMDAPAMDIAINRYGHHVVRIYGVQPVEFQNILRVIRDSNAILQNMPPVYDLRENAK